MDALKVFIWLRRKAEASSIPGATKLWWEQLLAACEAARQTRTSARLIFIFKTLLLALTYYGSGMVGALLAVPPGYTTPIWPPAGIALSAALLVGYRASPGIFLGSFFVNLWISFMPLPGLGALRSGVLATVVALGATLQALTGAFLVRRFIGLPTSLTEPRAVVGFLLLAGPASCLVSPTIGVTSLFVGGVIPSAQYAFSWWTSWVGDTIGVVLLTPLILIWTAEPREIWRRRRVSVTAPLGLVLVMITLSFLYATKQEQAAVYNQFEQRAQDLTEAIKKNLGAHLEVLYSIQNFYMASTEVNRDNFSEFVRRFLERHPSILALSWSPYVPQEERAIFEESMRHQGFALFQITERSATGQLVPAANRAGYVSVQYIEPLLGNERALGYDVASDEIRLQALIQARDSGRPTATAWIRLLTEKGELPAFLVFLPVYRKNTAVESTTQRRRNLVAYSTGVFRIPDIIKVALKGFADQELELTLFDADVSQRDRVAYVYSPTQQVVKPFATKQGSSRLAWNTTIDVAGRSWTLDFSPTPAYLAAQRSLQSWATGAVGLLISALLGAYLLVATGHTYEVENLAEKLTTQTLELTKAHKVKDEFISVISHELRTPLSVTTGYLGILRDGTLGDINTKQRKALDKIYNQTQDQLTMINSILQVVQLDSARLTVDRQLVNLVDLLESLKDTYAFYGNELIDLRWDYSGDLPSIITDGDKIKHILQNIINNAMKFTEQGQILISARYVPETKVVEFQVSDSGIGISREEMPFIFDKFWQADGSETRAYGGVGIGLYIVKQFTHLLGGKVSVESESGKGSTFTVSIPAIT